VEEGVFLSFWKGVMFLYQGIVMEDGEVSFFFPSSVCSFHLHPPLFRCAFACVTCREMEEWLVGVFEVLFFFASASLLLWKVMKWKYCATVP